MIYIFLVWSNYLFCDGTISTPSTALYTPSPTLHGHYNHYLSDINHTLPYPCINQCPLTPLAAQPISSFMSHTYPISPIPPILIKFECSTIYKHTYYDWNTPHIYIWMIHIECSPYTPYTYNTYNHIHIHIHTNTLYIQLYTINIRTHTHLNTHKKFQTTEAQYCSQWTRSSVGDHPFFP